MPKRDRPKQTNRSENANIFSLGKAVSYLSLSFILSISVKVY
jgi:hypothetical protein